MALRRREVLPHDGRLVLDESQVQCLWRHVQLLIDEEELRLVGDVAEQILHPVQMRDGLLRAGDEANDALCVRDVDEAVADPCAAHDLVGQLVLEVEGHLEAVLVNGGAGSNGRLHCLLVMPQDVEGIGAHQHDVAAILRPDYELGHHIDPADEAVFGPVVEADEVPAAHAEEAAAEDLVDDEGRFEGEALLEILEHRDLAVVVSRGVGAGVRPHEFQGGAE
mmetsp:Transcript_51914/g.151199  ORF Transcript_51914/g.151199 Transcript_51914/m.151199 type:complete len:222 (+) Transcript_51914:766-1431(+)